MKQVAITRRSVLAGATAGAALLAAPSVRAQSGSIKIGASVPLTGWGAGGASASTTHNYSLWADQVNAAGGIMVDGVARQIDLIVYDDRTQTEDAVRNVERLINQDKADFIMAPWGTGFNLAVGPILNQANYPHLAVAAVTDQAPQLAQRWKNAFFLIGQSSSAASAMVSTFNRMVEEHGIEKTVALVSVQDQFGLELSRAAKKAFAESGFEVVMESAYPLGTQDLGPIVSQAKDANPAFFVGASYPPDTIALTEQSRILGFDPAVFYTAVGTAYPLFRDTFGAASEGVMGPGGMNMASPGLREYMAAHTAHAGSAPDYWAAPVTYASLQMLQASIERVGMDRSAVIEELATGQFETIVGSVELENNMRQEEWWVGQWQDGDFVAVGPESSSGTVLPRLARPSWG
tara:strand:- start:10049 stop:11263 length:1215 start_codon:yes stop_codon:yes gene_type:complete